MLREHALELRAVHAGESGGLAGLVVRRGERMDKERALDLGHRECAGALLRIE